MDNLERHALTLKHDTDQSISQDKAEVMAELIKELAADRSSLFNRTFLQLLEENPDLSLAEAWEQVEAHFAQKGGVPMRKNPYASD